MFCSFLSWATHPPGIMSFRVHVKVMVRRTLSSSRHVSHSIEFIFMSILAEALSFAIYMPSPLRSCSGDLPKLLKASRASTEYLSTILKEFTLLRTRVPANLEVPHGVGELDEKVEKHVQHL